MSKEDARRATHYAVNEMNGFPAWFGDLANLQPEAVGEILSDCVRGEWQFPADRQNVHEVLSDLTWRGPGLTPLVSDTLLHQLQTGDPPNVSILELRLTVLRCIDTMRLRNWHRRLPQGPGRWNQMIRNTFFGCQCGFNSMLRQRWTSSRSLPAPIR